MFMQKFQQQLKQLREKQQLSIETVASQIGFSSNTIEMLENTEDLFALKLPVQSLKNYFRKYAECLETPEKKIISMLNRIDYLDYKRMRKAKPKLFDYLNRLVIISLVILLGWLVYIVYMEQKANALKQSIVKLPSPVNVNKTEKAKDHPVSNQPEVLLPPQALSNDNLPVQAGMDATDDVNVDHMEIPELLKKN